MSTNVAGQNKAVKHYINSAITIVLMLSGFFLPTIGQLTELGMQLLMLFVGMVYGWCTCGMLWPSFLAIVLLGFTSYATGVENSLGMFAGSSTTISMFGALLVMGYINSVGLTDKAALWILTRKFVAGKPWAFSIFLFFACFILGICLQPVSVTLIVWSFMAKVFAEIGMGKEDGYTTFIIVGVCLLGGYGGLVLPFMPHAFIVANYFVLGTGAALSLGEYVLAISLPMITLVLLYWIIGRFIFDGKKFAEGSRAIMENGNNDLSLNKEQKGAFLVLIIFVVVMILSSIFPSSWKVTQILTKLGVGGVTAFITIALLILWNKSGKPLGDFATMVTGGISWDLLWLVGVVMVIGPAMISGDTGLVATFAGLIVPLINKVGTIPFCIILVVFLCVVTQFAMNMILQMVFIPLLAPIFASMGVNPVLIVMLIFFGSQLAILSPSASIQAAMCFGNEDTNIKHLYKIGFPWVIIGTVLMFIWSFVLANFI